MHTKMKDMSQKTVTYFAYAHNSPKEAPSPWAKINRWDVVQNWNVKFRRQPRPRRWCAHIGRGVVYIEGTSFSRCSVLLTRRLLVASPHYARTYATRERERERASGRARLPEAGESSACGRGVFPVFGVTTRNSYRPDCLPAKTPHIRSTASLSLLSRVSFDLHTPETMKPTSTFALIATLLVPSSLAVEYTVSTCAELADADDTLATGLTIESSTFSCDEYTRFRVRNTMILKATVPTVEFSNFSLKVLGELTVEPDVTFTGVVEEVRDVCRCTHLQGRAQSCSSMAPHPFPSSRWFCVNTRRLSKCCSKAPITRNVAPLHNNQLAGDDDG